MRTLEEIIETMTLTCDVNSQYREQNADVLHYLKLYQSALKQMEANQQIIEDAVRQRDAHIKALAKLNRNEPLTWEELKTMEGKPVWVEALLYKQWAIIAYIGVDHIRFEGANLYAPECRVYMGADNGWQAYRKERS